MSWHDAMVHALTTKMDAAIVAGREDAKSIRRSSGGSEEVPGTPARPLFDGDTFEPAQDHERLSKQLRAVLLLMLDGNWRTLQEIGEAAGCPMQSASARLRDLRKDKFGGYTVERRRHSGGLYQYRVVRGRDE